NKLSADQCTHIVDGKKYTVLRKKAIGQRYIQWRFCGSGNKLDRQICQYKNKCYLEESITRKMKKLDARTGQDCYKLMRKMQNDYRETFQQMFINSPESCDLNKMIPSPGMEDLFNTLPSEINHLCQTCLEHIPRCNEQTLSSQN
uniref:Uncharacterized protein n=1 Tax=Romanomermis culicivorax TaxID=13658 RepID=A0A915JZ68_ROMCU